MRKLLLTTVCCLLGLGAQAQTSNVPNWTKQVTGVTTAADLYIQAPVAVDNAGCTYATGQFTQPLSIGSAYLEPIANSSYLAKYDTNGTALWAVSLQGAATITSITTDAANNVYVAGTFADVVVVGSTDNNTKQITGKPEETAKTSSFIAAFKADGKLQAVRAFYPSSNADVEASGLYFPESGYPYARISHIEADNGRLYVSLAHTGDLKLDNVSWTGMYVNVFDFMYMDIASGGILSVKADDLTDATAVAHVGVAEQLQSVQMGYESLNFTVNNGTVYLCFVANGNIKYEAGEKSETLQLTYDDIASAIEHAFIVSAIKGEDVNTKVFHSKAHDVSAAYDIVGAMRTEGDNLYIGGTFHQALAFDNSITSVDGCDLFVAALNKETLEKQWTANSGFAEGEGDALHFDESFNTMMVNNGQVYVYGYAENNSERKITTPLTYICSAEGATRGEDALVTGADINGTTKALLSVNTEDFTQIVANYTTSPDAIESIAAPEFQRAGNTFYFAEPNTVTVYDMQGRAVKQEGNATSINIDNLNKGIYILSAGRKSVKVCK